MTHHPHVHMIVPGGDYPTMMSMRPPQHGQGQWCARGSPGSATLGSSGSLTCGGMASNSRNDALIEDLLRAGARGYLLKSDANRAFD